MSNSEPQSREANGSSDQGRSDMAQGPAPFTDPTPPRSAFAAVNGIKLYYLDWGGSGPPLVMVHGIGDNPHVFDDLASHLRDSFRIIAYARRAHGRSDAPAGPYDGATLVEDLRQLLDTLGIQRTSLVGWSMGGNEITAFAGQYPDRVDRLVYLEAGYDWSRPAFFNAFVDALAVNSPGATDVLSVDAFRAWYREAWLGEAPWSLGLEAYLRDVAQPDAMGKLHPVPNEKAFAALLETLGSWQRDYRKVRAPALVLYATAFFPLDPSDAALAQKVRDFEQNTMVPFRAASMERIRRELPGAKVLQLSGRTHMSIGVEKTEELAVIIRDFWSSPVR
ncbi:alpha/beta fold hydrolase [Microvirga vignae]|uniref:alpha/beta fold hydrolase n=1 Tax=Microvirga vignae TaxID=1225564 RepID=UPI000AAF17AE|nr:alpha/beta hydrolase [Microvirga vignae]